MTLLVDPFAAAISNGRGSIELDDSQRAALKQISDWYRAVQADPKVHQVFRLGGAAGSGKTTIIEEILGTFPESEIVVTTFTGAASDVLRRKGIADAINYHQIWYEVDPGKMATIERLKADLAKAVGLQQRSAVDKQIERIGKPFRRVETLPYDLAIVDEASMVSGRDAEDLLRYGKPVLAIGDPKQLPPVDTNRLIPPLFSNQKLDYELTGQWRTADTSVLEVVDAARAGKGLPAAAVVKDYSFNDYDVVLTNTNAKRWDIIVQVRSGHGKPIHQPVAGDKIVVLQNSPELDLFNGSQVVIDTIRPGALKDSYEITTDTGRSITVDTRGFKPDSHGGQPKIPYRGKVLAATFCEALTVHKAQGSEWDRVLVAQDNLARKATVDDKERWRYTAVSRAKQVVHVVGDSFTKPVQK